MAVLIESFTAARHADSGGAVEVESDRRITSANTTWVLDTITVAMILQRIMQAAAFQDQQR